MARPGVLVVKWGSHGLWLSTDDEGAFGYWPVVLSIDLGFDEGSFRWV